MTINDLSFGHFVILHSLTKANHEHTNLSIRVYVININTDGDSLSITLYSKRLNNIYRASLIYDFINEHQPLYYSTALDTARITA